MFPDFVNLYFFPQVANAVEETNYFHKFQWMQNSEKQVFLSHSHRFKRVHLCDLDFIIVTQLCQLRATVHLADILHVKG